jgi:predicted RNA binding protein YcfA (HicA-like mRNA interferase family)
MATRDKLIARIRARPSEADYEDVKALLEQFGWHHRGDSGSHSVFVKTGESAISIPKVGGRKVKRHYLNINCERLGLDDDR